ncbi:MAG TPA: hypothetical protein VN811_16495, partial [Thermoanaerobaculia bacterium]|nr:hypothetical protein [Thermoanaerobaculia bacterium]
MPYVRRVADVPVALVDEVVAALAQAGTLGIEESRQVDGVQRLVAYFAAGGGGDVELPAGVRWFEEGVVPAADWLASYRESAQPLEVGERFVIDPREPDEPAPAVAAGRMLLRVPAR